MLSSDFAINKGSWGACYKGIRQVNIFVQYIDINENSAADQIVGYMVRVRFVRTYYYWSLLCKYTLWRMALSVHLLFLSSFLIVGKEKIDYFCFQYQKGSSYGCSNKENPLWDDEFRGYH